MRPTFVALLLLFLAALPASAEEPPATPTWSHLAEPAELPALHLVDLGGGGVDLGGHVVIHFWATWCAPCVAELPELERVAESVAARGVRVVAVSEDRDGAESVRPFLARLPPLPHLTMLLDPGRRAAARLRLKSLPVTIVTDRDGRELARLFGAGDWNGADRRTLESELAR
jgi:thiol-disulfide isomerase/thioredoxin